MTDLDDPTLVLTIYLERLNPIVADTCVIEGALYELAEDIGNDMKQDENIQKKAELIARLLQDVSFDIFSTTISMLRILPVLLDIVSQDALEQLFHNEVDPARKNLLLEMILDTYSIDISEWLETCLRLDPNNIEMSRLLIRRLIWSNGVPTRLVELRVLETGIPDEIRIEVLKQIIENHANISEQWTLDLSRLRRDPNVLIARQAAEILGEPYWALLSYRKYPLSWKLWKKSLHIFWDKWNYKERTAIMSNRVDAHKIIAEGDIDSLVDSAKQIGQEIARQSTTSQIPNIFGEVRRIEMNLGLGENDQAADDAYRSVVLLEPKLAYQARRERGHGVELLRDVLEPCIEEIRKAGTKEAAPGVFSTICGIL